MSGMMKSKTAPVTVEAEMPAPGRDSATATLETAVKRLGRDAVAAYEAAEWKTHDAAVSAIQGGGVPALVARAFFMPGVDGPHETSAGRPHNSTRKNRPEMTDEGRLLVDERWLRDSLCVSRATVMRWRDNGTLPPPVLLPGRLLRWRMADIEEWIKNGCRNSRIDGRRGKM